MTDDQNRTEPPRWGDDPDEPGPFDYYNELWGLAASIEPCGHRITLRTVPSVNADIGDPGDNWRSCVSATFTLEIDELAEIAEIAQQKFDEYSQRVNAKREAARADEEIPF